MLHWIRPAPVAFAGAVDIDPLSGVPDLVKTPLRAFHARMLAYAATRRRAALASFRNDCRIDALYWKASAPQAIAKARALRRQGLATLP